MEAYSVLKGEVPLAEDIQMRPNRHGIEAISRWFPWRVVCLKRSGSHGDQEPDLQRAEGPCHARIWRKVKDGSTCFHREKQYESGHCWSQLCVVCLCFLTWTFLAIPGCQMASAWGLEFEAEALAAQGETRFLQASWL